jgi:hypothetical protein
MNDRVLRLDQDPGFLIEPVTQKSELAAYVSDGDIFHNRCSRSQSVTF